MFWGAIKAGEVELAVEEVDKPRTFDVEDEVAACPEPGATEPADGGGLNAGCPNAADEVINVTLNEPTIKADIANQGTLDLNMFCDFRG